MTPNEAGQILAMLQANWPRVASNDLAAQEWINDLCGMEQAPALEAYRTLRANETRAPSWATFLEAYQMHRRRLAPALNAGPQGWSRPTDEDQARVNALVEVVSERLRASASENRTPMRSPARVQIPRKLDLKARAAARTTEADAAPWAPYLDVYGPDPEIPLADLLADEGSAALDAEPLKPDGSEPF